MDFEKTPGVEHGRGLHASGVVRRIKFTAKTPQHIDDRLFVMIS